jgi:hypothetical protein
VFIIHSLTNALAELAYLSKQFQANKLNLLVVSSYIDRVSAIFRERLIDSDLDKEAWEHGPEGGVLRGFLRDTYESAAAGEDGIYNGNKLHNVDLQATLAYMVDYAMAVKILLIMHRASN